MSFNSLLVWTSKFRVHIGQAAGADLARKVITQTACKPSGSIPRAREDGIINVSLTSSLMLGYIYPAALHTLFVGQVFLQRQQTKSQLWTKARTKYTWYMWLGTVREAIHFVDACKHIGGKRAPFVQENHANIDTHMQADRESLAISLAHSLCCFHGCIQLIVQLALCSKVIHSCTCVCHLTLSSCQVSLCLRKTIGWLRQQSQCGANGAAMICTCLVLEIASSGGE